MRRSNGRMETETFLLLKNNNIVVEQFDIDIRTELCVAALNWSEGWWIYCFIAVRYHQTVSWFEVYRILKDKTSGRDWIAFVMRSDKNVSLRLSMFRWITITSLSSFRYSFLWFVTLEMKSGREIYLLLSTFGFFLHYHSIYIVAKRTKGIELWSHDR